MSNLKEFELGDKLPLGAIVTMYDTPDDGRYLPTGSTVNKNSYPELSNQFTNISAAVWTTHPITGTYWNSVAYGNGVFVVTGDNNNGVFVSEDNGNTWTNHSTPLTTANKKIAFSTLTNKFVLINMVSGVTPGAATSSDGKSWNPESSFVSGAWYGWRPVNGNCVAYEFGSNRTLMWNSGSMFQIGTLSSFYSSILYMAYGLGKIIAIDYGLNKFVVNGVVTVDTPGTDNWMCIIFDGTKFIMSSSDNSNNIGKIAYSYDGNAWTIVTVPLYSASDYIVSIAHNNGKYIGNIANPNYIIESKDGIDWYLVNTQLNTTFFNQSQLIFENNIAVMVQDINYGSTIAVRSASNNLLQLGTAQPNKYVKVKN